MYTYPDNLQQNNRNLVGESLLPESRKIETLNKGPFFAVVVGSQDLPPKMPLHNVILVHIYVHLLHEL